MIHASQRGEKRLRVDETWSSVPPTMEEEKETSGSGLMRSAFKKKKTERREGHSEVTSEKSG